LLGAQQTIKTGGYLFTAVSESSEVWLVWARQPTQVLDPIFRDAREDGVIHNPAQQVQLQNFFQQHEASSTELIQDESRKDLFSKDAAT